MLWQVCHDCAVVDVRRLPQFRVTVNSRCGRKCFYCRPSGEAIDTAAGVQINADALIKIATSVRRQGIDAIKLTGGDPALYKHLVHIAHALKDQAGYAKVEIISRHPRIGVLAPDLAAARVDQINISLDTIDAAKHAEICGVDDLPNLLSAIESCVSVGLTVKVNTVVMAGVNDGELPNLIDRCATMGVTTVKLLDVIDDLDQGGSSFAVRLPSGKAQSLRSLYMPFGAIAERLREQAISVSVRTQGDLGHPMTAYRLSSGIEVLVKDSQAGAWYGDVCTDCAYFPCHDALMAMRLTADLRLQFCLLRSDNVVDLSKLAAVGAEVQLDRTVQTALAVYSRTNFTTQPRKSPTLIGIQPMAGEQTVPVNW